LLLLLLWLLLLLLLWLLLLLLLWLLLLLLPVFCRSKHPSYTRHPERSEWTTVLVFVFVFAFAFAFAFALVSEIGLGFSPGIRIHPESGFCRWVRFEVPRTSWRLLSLKLIN